MELKKKTLPVEEAKGERFSVIPKEYKEWVLKSFDWHKGNNNLKLAIEASLLE